MQQQDENIGRQILNYRLVRRLGKGGMATVYLAEHSTFEGDKAAVKLLSPHLAAQEQFRKRFKNEATIMRRLQHPNIVRVIDFHEGADTIAIIMELLEGQGLDEILKPPSGAPPRPMSPERVLALMGPVLEAFGQAHRQGVVHRDVKPSNIFIGRDGTPKVLDFGIAKMFSEAGEDLSSTGMHMGTLVYMSPEQVKDAKHVDARSDIYSLGVMLYHMLTGKKAYDLETQTDFDVRVAIVNDPLPALPAGNPLAAVVARATRKKPEERFQDCQAFALAMRQAFQKGPAQDHTQVEDPTRFDTPPKPTPPKPKPPQPDAEPADWRHAQARDDKPGYLAYLEKHPQGKHAAEAAQRLRRFDRKPAGYAKWAAIGLGAALLVALLVWALRPNEADHWREAQAQDTPEAYQAFLLLHPDGENAPEARVALDWARASAAGHPDSIRAFQRRNPGQRQQEALAGLARLTYDSLAPTADLSSLRLFLASGTAAELAPEDRERAQARARQLEQDSARLAGDAQLRAADDDAYAAAKRQDSKASYEGYISEHPQGRHLAEARQAIERLAQAPQVPQAVRDLQASMVSISGGSFTMGGPGGDPDELPAHQVTVSGFQMGKYEVTQAQWQAVMGSNPSGFQGCPSCPVESVSWDDVQAFIRKLNTLTGQTYRLPTEAEWEYAAGGGSSGRTKFAGTDSEGSLGGYAWYSANSGSKTHPVGQKSPNRLGLYDMSGNVWEWCSDWYGPYPSGAQTNPRGANSGSGRVSRGGYWGSVASLCRVAGRSRYSPGSRHDNLGFRLARTP